MRAVPVLVAVSFMAMALVPLAAADDDSLKVVVLVEDKAYSSGTTGKVTVHVFDKGAHVDADKAPEVTAGFYPTRDINVTRKSAGVYEGSYTLDSGDVFMGAASLRATATVGKSNESDTTYNEDSGSASILLPSSSPTGLDVDCYIRSVSGGVLKPGASVTIEMKVQNNGTPVEPGTLGLEASYHDRGWNTTTRSLNTTKTAAGVYQAVYEVPDLPYDVTITLRATATYQSSSDQSSTTVSVDFFNVVYHHISRTPTGTTFDVYVADINGRAVKGAVMALAYWPDTNGSAQKRLDPATTDSGGKARFTMPFPDGTKVLHVEGTANASGRSQSFSGTIRIQKETPSAPKPMGDGFEVRFAGTDEMYPAGSTVSREYYVFNNSKAWANRQVYCYIVFNAYTLAPRSLHPVAVEVKTLTTDASGRKVLSVGTPAGKDTYAEVTFESATRPHPKPDGWLNDHDSLDGQRYDSEDDSFMTGRTTPGEVVKVTVKELRLGSPTEISATARSGDRPLAFAAWGEGEVTDIMDPAVRERDWTTWNQVTSILTRSGSKYTGTVTIPSFMPRDSRYTVVVMLDSSELMPGYGMSSLKVGEGTAAGDMTWIYIVILLVVVVIVIVAVVVLLRRRSAPVPPSDVVNFAGAPAQTQPPAVPPGGKAPPGETAGPAGPGAPPPTAPPQYPPPPPQQYQQAAPQQYPPPPPQQYQQPAQQQAPPPQPAYVAAPPPAGPLPPPSRSGRVSMPNNAMCAFCNQWLLQGSPGIMCQCGKAYHEHCAKIQEKCSHCGTKLT